FVADEHRLASVRGEGGAGPVELGSGCVHLGDGAGGGVIAEELVGVGGHQGIAAAGVPGAGPGIGDAAVHVQAEIVDTRENRARTGVDRVAARAPTTAGPSRSAGAPAPSRSGAAGATLATAGPSNSGGASRARAAGAALPPARATLAAARPSV